MIKSFNWRRTTHRVKASPSRVDLAQTKLHVSLFYAFILTTFCFFGVLSAIPTRPVDSLTCRRWNIVHAGSLLKPKLNGVCRGKFGFAAGTSSAMENRDDRPVASSENDI